MQWFENEEFWIELYDFMFSPERFAAAHEEVDQVFALAGLTGGKVLDLCCGPGRHSVAFARRGCEVTGVDRSPFLLSKARTYAAESGAAVEWVERDMRHFRRPAAFDLALSLFTSFGYFEDEEDDLRVLRNVHESLRDGGVLVMDVTGKEKLARVWQNAMSVEFGEGCRLVMLPRLTNDWCRVSNEWIVLKDGRSRTFHFEHSLYSGRELKDRLLGCGFREVRLFGHLRGAPFDLDAPRLVAVARK